MSTRNRNTEIPTDKMLEYKEVISQLLNSAISFDEQQKYKEAVQFYNKVLESIREALKIKFDPILWENCGKIRELFLGWQSSCSNRVKEVQFKLDNPGLVSKKPPKKKIPYKKLSSPTRKRMRKQAPKTKFVDKVNNLFLGKPTTTRTNKPASIKRLYQPVKKVSSVQRPRSNSHHKELNKIDKKILNQILDEVLDKSTNVTFEQISGLDNAKSILNEAIIMPRMNPNLFNGLRSPPKGILLFGPPGNGKTYLAKAVANECGCYFFALSASTLVSKWHGESEKMVKALFEVAACLAKDYNPKTGQKKGSIIFLDEVDSILSKRSSSEHEASRRLKTEFLQRIQGVQTEENNNVLVLAATNLPFDLDDAVLRRFSKRVLIPLPNKNARKELIKKVFVTHSQTLNMSQYDLTDIAARTVNYSCSDITELCREASMVPIRELGNRIANASKNDIRRVNKDDFIQALNRIKPSVDIGLIKKLKVWNKEKGSA